MSEVVIVGAGLAGLCCALRLQEAGIDYLVVEASDGVGGRARTDAEGGFLFDRGFQVLLTSYPEVGRVLDRAALDLRYFESGCLVFRDGRFHALMDPWRHPGRALGSALSPFGSLFDKIRVARLRSRVMTPKLDALMALPEVPTRELLAREGFSEEMREAFFQPFLGGVFLDPELTTSSRKFHWVFRMFSTGRAAVPAGGMGAIARQLAAHVPVERLVFNAPVRRVGRGCVSLADGRDLLCAQAVVATDGATAAGLIDGLPEPRFRTVTNLYYSLAEAPVKEPLMIFDGEGAGPVNNLAFMSQVAPGYAPAGRALASVTVLGIPASSDRDLDDAVRRQLVGWFGMRVGDWRLERIYRIERALPDQPAGALADVKRPARLQDWLVVAGDWRGIASINGAMESGRLAAEAVLEKVLD